MFKQKCAKNYFLYFIDCNVVNELNEPETKLSPYKEASESNQKNKVKKLNNK